jgi:hypothetical protein
MTTHQTGFQGKTGGIFENLLSHNSSITGGKNPKDGNYTVMRIIQNGWYKGITVFIVAMIAFIAIFNTSFSTGGKMAFGIFLLISLALVSLPFIYNPVMTHFNSWREMADGSNKINASSILDSISYAIKKLDGLDKNNEIISYDSDILNKAMQEQTERSRIMKNTVQKFTDSN